VVNHGSLQIIKPRGAVGEAPENFDGVINRAIIGDDEALVQVRLIRDRSYRLVEKSRAVANNNISLSTISG